MNAPVVAPSTGKYLRYQLSDRYEQTQGRVFLTGIQALVRLPLDLARLDRQNGLHTAGFISGYRGSPLGGYDQELWHQQALLQQHSIRFQPGLNEDLAAAMVWGTQQAQAFPGSRHDGVFGLWYGKGPGLDRSADALRHANAYGTTQRGGVLACVGDDHTAQSSVFPHQSDHIFEAVMMPTLSPASIEEYLTLGLAGYAMSRFCGLWAGFKTVTEVVESGRTLTLPEAPHFILPTDLDIPPHGFNADPHLSWPQQRSELERRVVDERLPAAQAFARANQLDRVVFGAHRPRLGLITVGRAHLDTLRALQDMGIDEAEASRLGIAIYRPAMTWPVEPQGLCRFADGLSGLLVIEEKRPFVERQVKDQLYHLAADRRPTIAGKQLPNGAKLLPDTMDLTPSTVARAIAAFLRLHDVTHPAIAATLATAAPSDSPEPTAGLLGRKPYFCSGCPHNTSTRVPDGSFASAGIGCHIMAMGEERSTRTWSHMGGEGAQWVGLAEFTDMPHLFVNMGDGTYQHSGVLAIRQAVVAGTTMTYKLLYNDAVAMTGGQFPDGRPDVFAVAAQIAAEGVKKLAIVSDDPEKYAGHGVFPAHATIHHREDLDDVQRQCRATPGVSVILYDQTCAAEKRRRRKRQKLALPTRALINERVCEGCGDCQKTSNCIAVEPSETPQGRKRRINQSACNSDLSCVDGFCPSFVTLDAAMPHRPDTTRLAGVEERYAAELADPIFAGTLEQPYNILITGIGGSGIVTIGAILAMAAHLEGKSAQCLNFTGLSQKNGAVLSHLQIAKRDEALDVARIHAGETDLLLAYDMVVAASAGTRELCDKNRTVAIGNQTLTPTADFIGEPDLKLDASLHRRAIERRVNAMRSSFVEATMLAEKLFGDATFAGIFMLGFAYQRGLVPLSSGAIDRAIDLNGVAVPLNRRAFLWGRIAANNPPALAPYLEPSAEHQLLTFAQLVERNAKDLAAYQNERYARRYADLVQRFIRLEQRIFGEAGALSEAVAKSYYKVLAYKDEYEVARLYTEGSFARQLTETFDGRPRLTFHMAPPLLAPVDPKTGQRRKIKLSGRWLMPMLSVLKRGKILRGTPFDPFGKQQDRKLERQLIAAYEADLAAIEARLDRSNLAVAVELASLPQSIRGFGHIKMRSYDAASARRPLLLEKLVSDHPLEPAKAAE